MLKREKARAKSSACRCSLLVLIQNKKAPLEEMICLLGARYKVWMAYNGEAFSCVAI